MNIFEFVDYKKFIVARVKRLRRKYAEVADAVGIQRTFLSMVLHKDHNLNDQQAFAVGRVLDLESEETDFFILLVQYARATDRHYRQHLARRIEDIQEAKGKLVTRLAGKARVVHDLTNPNYTEYFLNPYMQAIHMLALIPEYQADPGRMATRLAIGEDLVQKCLLTLQRLGVIEDRDGRWICVEPFLHMDNNSAIAEQNHVMSRLLAMQKAFRGDGSDCRISTVIVADAQTKREFTQALHGLVASFRDRLEKSEPVEIYQLNIDLFVR